jgi:hypothetical protein
MDNTIFNEVATFNPFETSFGVFLAMCKDVRRFAALAETFYALLGRLSETFGCHRPVLPGLGRRPEDASWRCELYR